MSEEFTKTHSLRLEFYTPEMPDELFTNLTPRGHSLELCRDIARGFFGGELSLTKTHTLLLELPLAGLDKHALSGVVDKAWAPVQIVPDIRREEISHLL